MIYELVILAAITGFGSLFCTGSKDVGNCQGVAVCSGAISLRKGLILGAIFEFLGCMLMSTNISETIGNKVVLRDKGNINDEDYAWGMYCSLTGALLWVMIAITIKMPLSSTQAIIGALIGFGLVSSHGNKQSIDWEILITMLMAWIVTPMFTLIFSYFFYSLMNIFIKPPLLIRNEQNMKTLSYSSIIHSSWKFSLLFAFVISTILLFFFYCWSSFSTFMG